MEYVGYPTPHQVVNDKTRFIDLLNKHGLNANKFIGNSSDIGIDDLINLDESRVQALCNFFNLNTIETIRFEKLVNELNEGEDDHDHNDSNSHNQSHHQIDLYKFKKMITTSNTESFIIQKLDDEHRKMKDISSMAQFMSSRTTQQCTTCEEQITQICEEMKQTLLNAINHKKNQLLQRIHQFKTAQLKHIESELNNIHEYESDIRETRHACDSVLKSQPYGDDRQDTITQIIQSLLSVNAKHQTYRNTHGLREYCSEFNKEICIEYNPIDFDEYCAYIEQMLLIQYNSNKEMNLKISKLINPSENSQTSPNSQNSSNSRANRCVSAPVQYKYEPGDPFSSSMPELKDVQALSVNLNGVSYHHQMNNNINNNNNNKPNRVYSYSHSPEPNPLSNMKPQSKVNRSFSPNSNNNSPMTSLSHSHRSNPSQTHSQHSIHSNSPFLGDFNSNNTNNNSQWVGMNRFHSASIHSNHSQHSAPPTHNNNNNLRSPVHNAHINKHNNNPHLTQSESNNQDQDAMQAFLDEQHNDDNDKDDDSVEALFEPGQDVPTPITPHTRTPNGSATEYASQSVNNLQNMTFNDDINPIKQMQKHNAKLLKEEIGSKSQNYLHQRTQPFAPRSQSLKLSPSHVNQLKFSSSMEHIQPIIQRNSVSHSRSSPNRSISKSNKWAFYGVGRNKDFEFGINHNRTIHEFEFMNWNIVDSNAHDEEDEKMVIMEDQVFHLKNTNKGYGGGDGMNFNKTWTDCLAYLTTGDCWSMYLFGSGSLYVSGSNVQGQLCLGATAHGQNVKSLVEHHYYKCNNISLRYISDGCTGNHSFAIASNGEIYAMGNNSDFQLGIVGNDNNSNVNDSSQLKKTHIKCLSHWPVKMNFFMNNKLTLKVSTISCGKRFTIFVTSDGGAYSCGTNLFGALGFGDDITNLRQPKLIDRLSKKCKCKHVCCGENHVVILSENGKIWTFGINNQGQLGRSTKNNLGLPAPVSVVGRRLSAKFYTNNSSGIHSISSGANHVTVVTSNSNKLYMWGANDKYQLGDGTTKMRNKPKLVQFFKNHLVVEAKCGFDHTVVITKQRETKQREVYCFGSNKDNQCQREGMNVITVPKILTFVQQPDIDQQIKKVFAGNSSTIVAVDTSMQILRVSV